MALTTALGAALALPVAAQDREVLDGANRIKVNLLALPVRTASLQYERLLSPRFSLAVSTNITPRGALPLRGYFSQFVDAEDTISNTILDESRVSAFSLTPEARYYFGRQPGSGFYLGGFLRVSTSSFTAAYTYVSSEGDVYPISGRASSTGFGGGLLLGAQFNLGPRVVLDWWALGAGVSTTRVKFSASTNLQSVDAEDRAEAERRLEEAEIFGRTFDVTVTGDGGTASGRFPVPVLRTGLALGFRF